MNFLIGGGKPKTNIRELYSIIDRGQVLMVSKEYIDENIEGFEYLGHMRINSYIVHSYRLIE